MKTINIYILFLALTILLVQGCDDGDKNEWEGEWDAGGDSGGLDASTDAGGDTDTDTDSDTDTDTDTDTDGDGDADGGDGGGMECNLDPITQDTVVDINIDVVQISGEVTINSGQMPNDTIVDDQDRAWLRFVDTRSGMTFTGYLDEAGPGNYAVEIFTGTYNVFLATNSSIYQNALPPSATTQLAQNVQINGTTTRNFDTNVAKVSGTVTLNGSAMPDNTAGYNRGTIRFTDTESANTTDADLGDQGAASYSVQLFSGTYNVDMSSEYSVVFMPASKIVRLDDNVSVTGNSTLNYNARTLDVSGNVTLGGSQMPDNGYTSDRGYIYFMDTVTGSQYGSYALGETGAAAYGPAELFAGSYNVQVRSNYSAYQDMMPDYAITQVQSNLSLTGDTTENFNVNVSNVTGEVSINGSTMPDNSYSYDRADLQFRDTTTLDVTEFPMGQTGAATYTGMLFSGTYDVFLDTQSGTYQDVLPPSTTALLSQNTSITGNPNRDFNAGVVQVSGNVTLNGSAMPDNGSGTYDRGYIRFVDTGTGETTSFPLGDTGAASYGDPLFSGTYDVFLNCRDSFYQNVLPPGATTRLAEGVSINSNMNRNYNAQIVQVSGVISLNGSTMPDDSIRDGNDRGWLSFVDIVTAHSYNAYFGEVGAADYAADIFTGGYNGFLYTDNEDYQDVLPPDVGTQVLFACP